MKKGTKILVAAIMALMVLTGCGRESFTCGACKKEITGNSHKVSAFGEEIKICDACHAEVNEAFDKAIDQVLEMYDIYESLVD